MRGRCSSIVKRVVRSTSVPIAELGYPGPIGGCSDRKNPADRLDPILIAMRIDKGGHRLNGRQGSLARSAWAKYADVLRRIIGLAQLTVLTLQRLQAICHLGRHTGPSAAIVLSLLDPFKQGLGNVAYLLRDRHDGRPAGGMVPFVVQDHPHRAGTDFRCKFVRCLAHIGSTFSEVGASGKPGPVHMPYRALNSAPGDKPQDPPHRLIGQQQQRSVMGLDDIANANSGGQPFFDRDPTMLHHHA